MQPVAAAGGDVAVQPGPAGDARSPAGPGRRRCRRRRTARPRPTFGRPAERGVGRRHVAEAALAVVGEELVPLGVGPQKRPRLGSAGAVGRRADAAVDDGQVERGRRGRSRPARCRSRCRASAPRPGPAPPSRRGTGRAAPAATGCCVSSVRWVTNRSSSPSPSTSPRATPMLACGLAHAVVGHAARRPPPPRRCRPSG